MSSSDLFGNPSGNARVKEEPIYTQPSFLLPTNQLEETVEEEATPPRSFAGLAIFTILGLTLLAAQCYRLQISQGSTNRALAEGNSVRILITKADRGLVTDINGKVLAQNSRQLALAINPENLPAKKNEREAVYKLLKEKAAINQKTLDWIEENRLKTPEIFGIRTNLSKDESLLLQEWFANIPGVLLQEIPIRTYDNLASLGHLLGYVGPASEQDIKNGYTPDQLVGKNGLEQVYNQMLTGIPGQEKAEVNAFGSVVRSLPTSSDTLSQPGRTLRLSLDSRLQTITADALKHELERRTKKFGDLKDLGASAVILDPGTGAIKAMVSLPDFNNQLFAQGISEKDYQKLVSDPANPLLNRTIQGQYPSGSVIKPMIAAGALQAGVINENTQVVTPDAIYVGSFRFPDWKTHGLTDLRKAIAESNDIFFYALGGGWKDKNIKGLGIDSLNAYLGRFGLGTITGLDLPGEQSGLLPTPDWKKKQYNQDWYIGDTYHSSIGQGYTLVTPLQMALATAAIANGGTVWQPQLAWSSIDVSSGQETQFPHKVLNKDFISPSNIDIVRQGMRQTVQSGSARPLNGLKVTSAGKTGTAEFGNKGLTHAWYTGFAPYNNPELAFAIMIEGGGESFYSSVPVAEEILRNYYNDPVPPGGHLNSEPDTATIQSLGAEFHGEH